MLATEHFVDCDKELDIFGAILRQDTSLRAIVVYDDLQGGRGKSELLRKFADECSLAKENRSVGPLTHVLIDFHNDIHDMQSIIEATIAKTGTEHFPEYHREWSQIVLPLAIIPQASRGVVTLERPTIVDSHVGDIASFIFKGNFYLQRRLSIHETRRLTSSFVSDLSNLPSGAQVAWLIDAVDESGGDTRRWLRAMLARIAHDEINNLAMVVAGKTCLDKRPQWQRLVYDCPLPRWGRDVIADYLQKNGLPSSSHLAYVIEELTDGRAVDVCLCVDRMKRELPA